MHLKFIWLSFFCANAPSLLLSVISSFSFLAFSISSAFLINGLPNLSAKTSSSPTLDVTENVHAKIRPLVQPKPPPEIQVVQNSRSNNRL